jgi:hypothetical protein
MLLGLRQGDRPRLQGKVLWYTRWGERGWMMCSDGVFNINVGIGN